MENKLVILEINEVPTEIFERYAEENKHSHIKKIIDDNGLKIGICADKIQLDPWIAWPSFHRGVNDEVHGILHLGQSSHKIDESYPPVWEKLSKFIKVGVFGSLGSHQTKNKERYSFFIPDYFAEDVSAYPPEFQEFDRFNIRATRSSARNIGSLPWKSLIKFVPWYMRKCMSLHTSWLAVKSLISEKINSKNKYKRRNIQTGIHSDVFCYAIKKHQPEVAFFYTNNVAASMHRFWSAATGNNNNLSKEWKSTYSTAISEALAEVDYLIGNIKGLGYEILIVTALGQEEIPASPKIGYISIGEPLKFFESIMGYAPETLVLSPTMVPDFAINGNENEVDDLENGLKNFSFMGNQFIKSQSRMKSSKMENNVLHHEYKSQDFKYHLSYNRVDNDFISINFQIDLNESENSSIDKKLLHEYGLHISPHTEGVNCTGQHSPFGTIIGPEYLLGDKNKIYFTELSDLIIKHFSIRNSES